MSEVIYFENHCESCGGGVEFPANGVGEQIPCPHCQRLMTLAFPADSDGNATKQIQAFLAASSFPTRRAELLLLTNFSFVGQVSELRGLATWTDVLNENPHSVVERFVNDGLLQECNSDLVRLLQTKSSSDLKLMATARKIPHSGTKETLAKRLVKADPTGMGQLFHSKAYHTCTPRGAVVVEKFHESEKEIQRQAEQETFLALTEERLKDACLSVAAFEASRLFPRGLGMNWQEYDCDRDLTVLQIIFSTPLKRLASFDQDTIFRLRVTASMMHLWGTNKPPACLPTDGRDLSVESRMLLSSALGAVSLQEIKRTRIKRVQVLASGLPGICSICRSENGKVYPVEAAPVLPHENCTCKAGCCCLLIATDPGLDDEILPIGL